MSIREWLETADAGDAPVWVQRLAAVMAIETDAIDRRVTKLEATVSGQVYVAPLAQVIREHVEMAIQANGNVRKAARRLRVPQATVYRWLAKWKAQDEAKEAAHAVDAEAVQGQALQGRHVGAGA